MIFNELKARQAGSVLAGDGRYPGHSAKFCTYNFRDVESQKVVDFDVVPVFYPSTLCDHNYFQNCNKWGKIN